MPTKDADTLSEKVLSRQLDSIKSDISVFKQLDHLDKHGLLVNKEVEPVAAVEAVRATSQPETTSSTTQHVDSQKTASIVNPIMPA